jgi:molybdopterin converting factor small subunit
MSITVELFGIPRQRAGVARSQADGCRLRDVLADIVRQFPQLDGECIADGRLSRGYLANLNGERFVTDPETPLSPGDSILILSADAGG